MTKPIRLEQYSQDFNDLENATKIGRQLWDREAVLDFSGVDTIPAAYLKRLLEGAFKKRSYTAAIQFIDIKSMSEKVQVEFLQVYQAMGESGGKPGTASRRESATELVAEVESGKGKGTFNPFSTLKEIQGDYLTYVESFQQIRAQEIKYWIQERLERGGLLWKPPYLQISLPYLPGESLISLVEEGILHPGILPFVRSEKPDLASPAIAPYHHQVEAIRKLNDSRNVIVATGTGSGKSFAFGIPIVSTTLRMKEKGVQGIKAVIVYPMNALANNQYDDFTERLHGSGLKIGRYTGDTPSNPDKALAMYKTLTGRDKPYDCEVLSRVEIQAHPPDILMTNYVMLELLLTRFEDRTLFRHQGVLQYLVLDEIHTYSGKQGADVAALIRRLKQHTGTIGKLTCIGTSATVESGEEVSAQEAIAYFASDLFGETVEPADVVGETYAPVHDTLDPQFGRLLAELKGGPRSVSEIASKLNIPEESITELILQQEGLPPKIHTFFSQGRPIHSCLGDTKHLNDRGDRSCPVCAESDKVSPTYPLVFCRACGAEYYSVTRFENGALAAAELDSVSIEGQVGYILIWEAEGVPEAEMEYPETWLTPTGLIQKKYQENLPTRHTVCRHCGMLDPDCGHEKYPALFIPVPFLFCPECGIEYDRRPREFSKLFSYGTVGRSTATDIILNAELRNLPKGQRKVIAFSDNRQDTALQAAHINSMANRMQFRRLIYNTLKGEGAIEGTGEVIPFTSIGLHLFNTLDTNQIMPPYDAEKQRKFGRGAQQMRQNYQRYLQFLTLRELEGTHRRIHQNLEDIGVVFIRYDGLDEFAAYEDAWSAIPIMKALSAEVRHDILHGVIDMMRLRLAIKHEAIIRPDQFRTEVINRINQDVQIHGAEFYGAIGYSDDAPTGRHHYSYRISGGNTQINRWMRKFMPLTTTEAGELLAQIVQTLAEYDFLTTYPVRGYGGASGFIYALDPDIILMQIDSKKEKLVCPRCLSVYHFNEVRSCYRTTCRNPLEERDLGQNYFLKMYTQPLSESTSVKAEEHSGQISGDVRMDIEQRFKDPENDLNVIVCTPTMELGIDIGDLNAVVLRNIPPSPSNYAQRAGRAGRKGQASLITAYAGVGFARGPHDQYFFRFPEKMISGVITAPRFRLDNPHLLRTHIHSLVLEVLGLGLNDPEGGGFLGGLKLPASPNEIMDIDHELNPMFPDLRKTWQGAIQRYQDAIQQAVLEAFEKEIEEFSWFTPEHVGEIINHFVINLDQAFDYWREEYNSLYQEGREIENHLLTIQSDKERSNRMEIISAKLNTMRNGEGDWYVYRYLGSRGFLPGYAFPPEAVYLSFSNSEDEISRNPTIAISEFAPGNYVYYRGSSYRVVGARAQSINLRPDTQPVRICPQCKMAYVGEGEINLARCKCGQDLMLVHTITGMKMCSMYAIPHLKISSDEEERRRLGFEVEAHHRGGGDQQVYALAAGDEDIGVMTLEKESKIFIVNNGQRQPNGDVVPFTLCSRCNSWLLSEKEIEEHVSTTKDKGKCRANAHEEDVISGLRLTHEFQSDVLTLDIPLPEGEDPEVFYTSLTTAIARGIMIAYNLDEDEIGYIRPQSPDPEVPMRMIFYETTLGGTGCLEALTHEIEFNRVVAKIREILHKEDDEPCERACYQCLLSFYNQRDHANLDRIIVMDWLDMLEDIQIQAVAQDEERYQALLDQCDTDGERRVLMEIYDRNIRLPEEGQKIIYDHDGVPLTTVDFFYEPKVIVFVDGSVHHLDYVRVGDEWKRKRLKALGYRVVVIEEEDLEGGIDVLVGRIG